MKYMNKLSILATVLLMAASCSPSGRTKSGLDPHAFESEYDGQQTELITITNEAGMEACITNLGGYVVSLMVPDGKGRLRNVLNGCDNVRAYLPENVGGPFLHGGTDSWTGRSYEVFGVDRSALWLALYSPGGDEAGDLQAYVTYMLTKDNRLDVYLEVFTADGVTFDQTNLSGLSCFDRSALAPNTGIVLTERSTAIDSSIVVLGPNGSFKSRKSYAFSIAE